MDVYVDRPARTSGPAVDEAPELRARYERYRLGEVMAFLTLVPREHVRTLYGTARQWAMKEGMHDGTAPMDSLLRYLLERLPLPTFAVWRADSEAFPLAHAARAAQTARGGPSEDPVTIAHRDFQLHRRRWHAGLHVFPDGDRWRGFISFDPRTSPRYAPSLRTANIFFERDVDVIRTAFSSYRTDTLQGFLRSSMQ